GRRVGLPFSMTEGFHPKPRIGFPSALALGVEGLDEVVEIDLNEDVAPDDLLKTIIDDRQPGLTIKSVKRIPEGLPKAQLQQGDFTISIPPSADRSGVDDAIGKLLGSGKVTIQRKKKDVTVDIASHVPELRIDGDVLRLSLHATEGASLRPEDILRLLGIDDWIAQGALIVRHTVHLKQEYETNDPQQIAIAPDPAS
ncbi:MAG: TIGR03936 family radical SAM-associated protein, partial [Planctomycetota bacterium]